ncbi:MAG: HAD-IIB family hydrolase [Clostridia bacterium]|nr:HAD-IIB family hydrolase [Clostridia bacterium]
MGKFDGVLLASDFDDTLYSSNLTGPDSPARQETDQGTGPILTSENHAALEYFIAQGGRFTVATGRSKRTFVRYVGRIPMNAPAILANGAVIYDFDAGKELYHATLRPQVAGDSKALAAAFPTLGFELQFDDAVYIYRPNDITWLHLKRLGLDYQECALEEMPTPWTKLVIQDHHGSLLEAQRYLNERWGDYYEPIFSNAHLLELTSKGSTKGGMVLRVAERLGISREHIYCIGDNQNDIPMLAVSAIPFAPANCAREVRDWGATLLGTCEENCVAQLVEILDRRY